MREPNELSGPMASAWRKYKGLLFGLAAGLIVGPFLSANLGWQVTSSTLEDAVEDAVVHEQAEMCAVLARAGEEKDPSDLDYVERLKVAERYARFPWNNRLLDRVERACTEELLQDVTDSATKEPA